MLLLAKSLPCILYLIKNYKQTSDFSWTQTPDEYYCIRHWLEIKKVPLSIKMFNKAMLKTTSLSITLSGDKNI